MRLPVALLSVVAVPAGVLAAPVVTTPAVAARPVAPHVQELDLPVAGAERVEALGATGAARTLVETPQRSTEPFTTLGVTWSPDPATGEVAVAVRTRSQGRWTDWTPVAVEEAEVLAGAPDARGTDLRAGTEPLYAGASDGVQVRVEVLSGRAPADVRLALVEPGSSPADAPAALPAGGTAHAAATPAIRSRAQWGADESIRRSAPSYAGTLSAVTVHHTASSNEYTEAEVPGLIRGFYAYHVKSLGWSDLGYNVLVDKFGNAWEGRAGGLDRPVIGAHAGGFNTGTAGVSMIGTYGTVEPSAAMKETVAQVAAWKLGLHDRDPRSSVTLTSAGSTRWSAGTPVTLARIFGHREVSSTACPGDRGQAALAGLRERAAALQGATAEPAPSAPAPGVPSPPPTPSAPPAPAKPFGALDAVTGVGGAVRVAGWVIDPDATTHTTVAVRVGSAPAVNVAADQQRPDLPLAYPQYGPGHGFDATLPLSLGRHTVCLSALDQGGTEHLALGCREVEVTQADPRGTLDQARPTADVLGVRVSGWALDPDAPGGSRVVVSVDGAAVRTVTADRPRPDVALLYPAFPERRGYDAIVPAPPGARRVCALAVNEGRGADVQLGCLVVAVPERPAPPAAPGSRASDDSCPDGAVPRSGFLDTGTSVHRAAVDCALWWGLTGGLTAERFGPASSLTRGQVASFLARLLTTSGAVLPAAPPDAFDDDRGSPHELAINQMGALGVLAGRGARRYEPGATVTRDQMASYLVRAYEQHVGAPLLAGGDWYRDDDGSVHETSIGKAARAGLTGGTGPGRYTPRAFTDRGQVASFLTRLLDLLVENGRAPRRS